MTELSQALASQHEQTWLSRPVASPRDLSWWAQGGNTCISAKPTRETTPGKIPTDDAALAVRVKQALVADPGLRLLPMSVATYRGVVQLSRYLDSEPQIQKALVVTRCVPGVRFVSNDLHLRPQ
jgi:hyperosmotically inducible protein